MSVNPPECKRRLQCWQRAYVARGPVELQTKRPQNLKSVSQWQNVGTEPDQGALTYWKERTMAVTMPMIRSKMEAMERNPPQEVKSTCDEQPVNRMKVKSGWLEWRGGGRWWLEVGRWVVPRHEKNATAPSPVASGGEAGFASYLKCHKYLKELSGPL